MPPIPPFCNLSEATWRPASMPTFTSFRALSRACRRRGSGATRGAPRRRGRGRSGPPESSAGSRSRGRARRRPLRCDRASARLRGGRSGSRWSWCARSRSRGSTRGCRGGGGDRRRSRSLRGAHGRVASRRLHGDPRPGRGVRREAPGCRATDSSAELADQDHPVVGRQRDRMDGVGQVHHVEVVLPAREPRPEPLAAEAEEPVLLERRVRPPRRPQARGSRRLRGRGLVGFKIARMERLTFDGPTASGAQALSSRI